MGRAYADEIRELLATYESANRLTPGLRDFQARISHLNVRFIGSGGSLALAELAAREHTHRTGWLAAAETPLSLVGSSDAADLANDAVVVFSARARHPDVALAALAARRRGAVRVVLVTQLDELELPSAMRKSFDEIVFLPRTSADGFLATNSILAVGTRWLVAAGISLPVILPALTAPIRGVDVCPERLVIVYAPLQRAAACDLEARLSESGLADVQVADLRNIAHGRHVGLQRRATGSKVLILVGPEMKDLGDRTASAIAELADVEVIGTPLVGLSGALDSMAMSMRTFGSYATAGGIDPGRPRVSTAGRKLYHLKSASNQRLQAARIHPADRKALAASEGRPTEDGTITKWIEHFDVWLERSNGALIEAVVLDYDGTCVVTDRRVEKPPHPLRDEVCRILDAGIRVGFASGRGPSLPLSLREWIPEEFWPTVIVGVYNGAHTAPLSELFTRDTDVRGDLLEIADVLEEQQLKSVVVDRRSQQLTLTPTAVELSSTLAVVKALLARQPRWQVKVLSSGHSIDIVENSTSKQNVARALGVDADRVLTVGDQGQVGGNDLELLAYSYLSLSVDRVSPDPERCWNLAAPNDEAPRTAANYLGYVRKRRGVLRLLLPSSSKWLRG